MRIRKVSRAAALALVSAVAGLSTLFVGASPASASWGDTAVAGTPPSFSSGQCATNYGSMACFQPYGDKIWVKDTDADGYAAYGYWENYLRNSNGDWNIYRSGRCDNHLGAGHWGYCNYDFYEDSTYNADGGYGSGVRVYPCTDYAGINTYAWVRNNG